MSIEEVPLSTKPPKIDFALERQRIEREYHELLHPSPPEEPVERKKYYLGLVKRFPKPGTADFSVLSLLVRKQPQAEAWSDPELWTAYVQYRKREFAQTIMEAFAPLASTLSKEIQQGLTSKENEESELRPMHVPYEDLIPAVLPLTELLQKDQDELREAMQDLRGCPLIDLSKMANSPLKQELIKLSTKFYLILNTDNISNFSSPLALEENVAQRFSDDPIGAIDEYYQRLKGTTWFDRYESASPEERKMMIGIVTSQANNGYPIYCKPFPLPTERFSGFLCSDLPPSVQEEKQRHVEGLSLPTEAIVVPIGAYGEPFARALVKTTYFFIDQAVKNLAGLSRELDEKYNSTLSITARRDALATMLEGILSMKDAIVLLMAEPGKDASPIERLERLVKSDLVSHMARLIPIGYVAPLVLTGRYVPDLTEEDAAGHLVFSESIRMHGNKMRQQRREKSEKQGGGAYGFLMSTAGTRFTDRKTAGSLGGYVPHDIDRRNVVETGLGCPVSHRSPNAEKSGLTELHEAFYSVMKSFLPVS